ncbi:ComF family protein [Hugenholtzia roseola]|uniref:ComF family protein n=1 Tax=Hugenholtzia roseola TaxID=1002 RepID=UPI00047E22FC|nr:ComF family protein [Hugenholtzia roseola]
MKVAQKIWQDLLSLFYPDLCLACKEVLVGNENCICTNCLYELPKTDYHRIPQQNEVCTKFWGKVPIHYGLAYLFFRKSTAVQQLMFALKYQGQADVGLFLGELFGRELYKAGFTQQGEYGTFDAILPIPLHPRKEAKRGYNQSAYFAQGLSAGLQVAVRADILVRKIETQTQTQKDRLQRFENMKSVFAIENRESIVGKHLLLVDDVITTGATLESALHLLLENGAAKVSVGAIAVAAR